MNVIVSVCAHAMCFMCTEVAKLHSGEGICLFKSTTEDDVLTGAVSPSTPLVWQQKIAPVELRWPSSLETYG